MLPIDPGKIPAEYAAALKLMRAGRLEQARERFAALQRLAPTLPEVPFQLGRIALRLRRPQEAVEMLEAARRLKPDEPAILAALAEALADLGDTEAALALHDRVIAAAPREVKPRADKALLLQRIGDFDAAEREFRKALKLAPKDGELYRVFLGTKSLKKGDPLIGAMQRAWADKAVTGRNRWHLGFALAKAMADSGQRDRVFRYLKPANDLLRRAHPYAIAGRQAEVEGLCAAFEGADFEPIGEAPDIAPIFVTGLPRSGTTLVEQILASHAQVTAGGEMRHALALAYETIGRPGRFARVADLPDDAIRRFAGAYADAVAAEHGPARIFTDKSIQSHLVLGLLAKALPQARLIVVRRDPRDLGLSIYRNFFGEGTHGYSTDLADIGAYIATFERMVSYWGERIPERMHEIVYEDLIAAPEAETRRLVAAAGLDWDPACLQFHETEREVRTLSLHQVRQPIYATSREAWRAYEADIAPLTEALTREGVL